MMRHWLQADVAVNFAREGISLVGVLLYKLLDGSCFRVVGEDGSLLSPVSQGHWSQMVPGHHHLPSQENSWETVREGGTHPSQANDPASQNDY